MAFGALAVREGESRSPHSRQLLRICGLAAVAALFDRDPRQQPRAITQCGRGGGNPALSADPSLTGMRGAVHAPLGSATAADHGDITSEMP